MASIFLPLSQLVFVQKVLWYSTLLLLLTYRDSYFSTLCIHTLAEDERAQLRLSVGAE